jgi:hypothetical protein
MIPCVWEQCSGARQASSAHPARYFWRPCLRFLLGAAPAGLGRAYWTARRVASLYIVFGCSQNWRSCAERGNRRFLFRARLGALLRCCADSLAGWAARYWRARPDPAPTPRCVRVCAACAGRAVRQKAVQNLSLCVFLAWLRRGLMAVAMALPPRRSRESWTQSGHGRAD